MPTITASLPYLSLTTTTVRQPYPRLRDLPKALLATAYESWPALKLVFYLTFPIILALRVIEEFVPLIEVVGGWLYPLMEIVGLPGETGIAWAAAIIIQPFPGFALLADNWAQLDLTIAQATIFGVLVLEVHAIFVEARIAHYLGVRVWLTCAMRFGTAFMLGFLLDWLYRQANWLQEPATLLIAGADASAATGGWKEWLLFQAKTWVIFAVFLYCLNLLMRGIRAFHVERFFIWLLSPVMRMMGIHKSAATIGVIGLILGLTFGAALLMAESKAGRIPRRDIFLAVALLGICHSLLDDTLLTLLFGAHLSGVLFFRFAFAVAFLSVFSRLLDSLPASVTQRWFMTSHREAN